MLDFSQVDAFENRLRQSSDTRALEDEWQRDESRELADTMRPPVRTGRLQASISPADGGVAIRVDYWPFVEYGTVNMAPQPFVRPAIRARTKPAADSAGERVIRKLT